MSFDGSGGAVRLYTLALVRCRVKAPDRRTTRLGSHWKTWRGLRSHQRLAESSQASCLWGPIDLEALFPKHCLLAIECSGDPHLLFLDSRIRYRRCEIAAARLHSYSMGKYGPSSWCETGEACKTWVKRTCQPNRNTNTVDEGSSDRFLRPQGMGTDRREKHPPSLCEGANNRPPTCCRRRCKA